MQQYTKIVSVLEEAWNDPLFWPFLSTEQATYEAKQNKQAVLIRLSNTQPGAITVTSSDKVCFVSVVIYR